MSRERLYPGYRHVTDIIDIFQKFTTTKKKLDEYADRGTQVHNAITAHLTGQFYVTNATTENYFSAYEKFNQENKYEIVEVQKRYFCDKLMITGEIDALFRYEGDRLPTINDFKTSRLENKQMWQLQGAFYRYLMKVNGIDVENKFRFIQLGGTYGMYFIREYEFTESLMDVCHAALTAHKYFYAEGT